MGVFILPSGKVYAGAFLFSGIIEFMLGNIVCRVITLIGETIEEFKSGTIATGGMDETRTRDLLRDRQAF